MENMSNGTVPQFRLVRCPRCLKVLPELPNVPVYQCGSCGTQLQAKIRKQDSKSTTLGLSETHASVISKLDLVSEGGESSNSSQSNLPSVGNCSPDQHNGRDKNESSHCHGDRPVGVSLPNENQKIVYAAKIWVADAKSTTLGLTETDAAEISKLDLVSEEGESSNSSQEILHSAGDCPLGQNIGKGQIESSNYHGGKISGVNLANEDQNNVSNRNASEDFVQKQDVELSNDHQKSGSDESDSEWCNNGQLVRDENLSTKDHNNGSPTNESLTCNVEHLGISDEDCSSNELSNLVSGVLPQSPLAGPPSEVQVIDQRLPLASKVEAEAESDANHDDASILISSSQGELIDTSGSASFVTAHWLTGGSISQERAHHTFDRVRSTDTFETTDFVTPSSELSGTLIDLSKSPTTRSSRAYYDDGVSSYEGTDDQLPDRHRHLSKHSYRPANHAASDVRTKREKFQASSNAETHHFRNSASVLPGKTQYGIKSSKLDRGELLETAGLDHPDRTWRRGGRDEYLSQHLFHQTEPLPGYEIGSLSDQLYNEFYYTSSTPSQDKRAHTEQEKMRLLRMVYELQDQINRTSLADEANGRVTWTDDHIPTYYDYEVPVESLNNFIHPRYSGRLGFNWPQQKKYSRIPFSAEATTIRHPVDHSLSCCPQDWQSSAQLRPHLLPHNKGFCRVHSRLNLYSSYSSCPSSPQRHVTTEFPTYSRGTKSEDQRHRDHEVKKHFREKHRLAKRHLRPIAGGAPLITCPRCMKQLQLPVDFLLFKRKFHQLRCGACSEVLKYSLVNKTHLIPYAPTARAPPPSEADEYNDATHRRNFTSTSHVTDCPCPDSDDFTDRDPASQTSFHTPHGNAVERTVSYSSPDQGKERKRSVLNDSKSKGKKPVEGYELAGPSTSSHKSNIASSEIEELPASAGRGGGSPLHRLMGYSSPSAVIFGYGSPDTGTSSYRPANGLT